MAGETKLNAFQGLYSSVDPFSRAPKGGFRIADNVMFKQPGLIEPRRGAESFQSLSGSPWSLYCGLVNSLSFGMVQKSDLSFQSYISTSSDPLLPTFSLQAVPFAPGRDEFSHLARPHPDAGRIRYTQANKNTYAITGMGLLKSEDNLHWVASNIGTFSVEDPNAQGYGIRATVTNLATATYNWLATDRQCAYKFRIVRQGSNLDYTYGAPSSPVKIQNTAGGNRAVLLGYNCMGPLCEVSNVAGTPNGLNVYVEIFRTVSQAKNADGTWPDLPEDYYKLAEVQLATLYGGADTGTVTQLDGTTKLYGYTGACKNNVDAAAASPYTDITVDAGLGGPLNTNPTDGDTAASAYAPPPAAADIAWFKNRMYLGNYIDCHRMVLPLTGTGNFGIAAGDTITIDGDVYTWQNASGFDYFKPVLLTGAGSVYLNLLASANSLVECINYGIADRWNQSYCSIYTPAAPKGPITTTQALRATYIGDASQPGSLLLERLYPGAPAFTVTYNSTGTNSYGILSGKTSDNNTQVAGLRYSEEGAPDSFPIANDLTIGEPGKKILRIIATKDSLWIFKEDGLYRVTDDGNGPQPQAFDLTIRLLAPDSVVALNNEIYALCTQGVLKINEQGKTNLSVPFQKELLELTQQFNGGDLMYSLASGTAYESEGLYILSLPESLNATTNSRHYVYGVDATVWWTWSFGPGMAAMMVDPQFDKLIFATGTNKLWMERKDFASTDHSDPAFSVGIAPGLAGTSASTMTFSTVPSPEIHRGDYISQTSGGVRWGSWVTDVSDDLKTVTLLAAPGHAWVNADLDVLPGIRSYFEFLPIVGEDELMAKTYDEHVRLYFWYLDHPYYNAWFATDEQPTPLFVDNGRVPAALLWGSDMDPWGSTLWGEDVDSIVSRVTFTDEAYARGAELDFTLEFTAAGKRFELASIAFGVRDSTSPRVCL